MRSRKSVSECVCWTGNVNATSRRMAAPCPSSTCLWSAVAHSCMWCWPWVPLETRLGTVWDVSPPSLTAAPLTGSRCVHALYVTWVLLCCWLHLKMPQVVNQKMGTIYSALSQVMNMKIVRKDVYNLIQPTTSCGIDLPNSYPGSRQWKLMTLTENFSRD